MNEGREARLNAQAGRWVGASVPRKEDRRMLLGRGRFTGDLTRAGMLHAAFARSPFAAAEVTGIDTSQALALPGVAAAFTAADLGHPYLAAMLERDEFTPTRMPVLAGDQVRFAGEPVAMVLASDPYTAQDAAELVDVDWRPLEPVPSIEAAQDSAARQVHDALTGNCLVDLTMFDDPTLDGIFAAAPVVIDAVFRSARVAALPLEGRACLAEWDDRDQQLVLHVSTQVPHQVRSGVAQALGIPEHGVRVIAPDVGGGFGLKCVVGREEIAAADAARWLRRPVSWIEDRQENLTASFHGHEQRYRVRAGFGRDGRILGLAAEIDCDVGAYSAFPFTSAVEPLMACTELPGIYKVPAYRARGRAIATNKAPTAPYRGVSRPQIVLVMERLMEKAAAELGIGALGVRRRNMISPGEFPYTGVSGISYDEGSYRQSLDLAERQVKETFLNVTPRGDSGGVMTGVGYACFSERTAYGTPTMSQRRMAMTPGYDTALVRMDPSGEVIVTTGTCGHGQGHETTFAQIVADRLGVHPAQVRLRQGDTDLASYGWGTWGSRSIVIGGGAADRAAALVARQLRQVAAHLLEASADDIELAGGSARVRGDDRAALPVGELARIVHFQTHRLPEELRYGLEARASFDPPGTFSNACHAAMVTVDPGTGEIRLRRYLVVEDCGVVINPMIVDGQVAGGVAQGVGAALLERVRYSEDGQPGSTTLMDYLAPTAAELCPVQVTHLETASQFSETGAKGMGEGGMIGAPAAVLNAINDALRPAGISFDHVPVLPAEVCAALAGDAVAARGMGGASEASGASRGGGEQGRA
ncbi:MAG TPA: xanthine dehydrogenase family protein molybdopterin-binding subunit [Streptosporangiaceae bacterium]|nr:xanthine dehydrogenase family protein molybdopterin-binding subunit [Streptosporangiaceae bacterium]